MRCIDDTEEKEGQAGEVQDYGAVQSRLRAYESLKGCVMAPRLFGLGLELLLGQTKKNFQSQSLLGPVRQTEHFRI